MDLNVEVKRWGGITLHDVIDDGFAHKAVEKGASGLTAVAAGAGGRAGTQSPFALVQEIRRRFDGPLPLSGAIATGSSILAAQAMAADLAYIGSAFIATREANAVERYKQMIVASSARDIVYSDLFTGVHGNYLERSIIAAGLDPANLPKGDYRTMNFGEQKMGAKAWRDVWGAVRESARSMRFLLRAIWLHDSHANIAPPVKDWKRGASLGRQPHDVPQTYVFVVAQQTVFHLVEDNAIPRSRSITRERNSYVTSDSQLQ